MILLQGVTYRSSTRAGKSNLFATFLDVLKPETSSNPQRIWLRKIPSPNMEARRPDHAVRSFNFQASWENRIPATNRLYHA